MRDLRRDSPDTHRDQTRSKFKERHLQAIKRRPLLTLWDQKDHSRSRGDFMSHTGAMRQQSTGRNSQYLTTEILPFFPDIPLEF